jgi:hypothetical protein
VDIPGRSLGAGAAAAVCACNGGTLFLLELVQLRDGAIAVAEGGARELRFNPRLDVGVGDEVLE